ncbi:MAG: hypothetical protein LUP99_04885 [Methanomicrobiales archaeon]|nr:hypothetical protein [Methanomicrobiales archaeon]
MSLDLSNVIRSAGLGWLLIPVLIFVATVCDVSLGTIRVILSREGTRLHLQE